MKPSIHKPNWHKPRWISQRTGENLYVILTFFCQGAAGSKLALQPKIHTSLGQLPIWQFVAGVLFAWLVFSLYQLVDGGSK